MFTIYADNSLYSLASDLAKGNYQQSLLAGSEAWSGSTLRGKAKQYGASYARSRASLLARLTAAGIKHRFETIERRKVLMIG